MRSPIARRRALPVIAALCCVMLAACGAQGSPTASRPSGRGTGRTPNASASSVAVRLPRDTAAQDWPAFGYDPQRSDDGPGFTGITVRTVGRLRTRTVTLDGIADSSAIAVDHVMIGGRAHDLVIVTTSYGNTIAIDPRTGRRLWEFRPRSVNRRPGNPQVTTASPVLDPGRRAVYAAAPNGCIYRLSLTTGRVQWYRAITFDPGHEKLAASLAIDGPSVIAVTGGYYGDAPPYDAHVVTLQRANGRIAGVFNTECSNRPHLIRATACPGTASRGGDAIWGRAGAVVEPGSGRLLVATGNGPFGGRTSWGDSVLELTPSASRLLHSWTPVDQAQLDHSDTDVGSVSPAILPAWHGRRLFVQGGKDGRLHLLDLARLDGTAGGAGPRLGGELSQTSTPGGGELLTAPAVSSRGGQVELFVATDSGTAAYRLVDPAHPRLAAVWRRATPATSPVLAGGLLYAYDEVHGALDVRRPGSGALVRSFRVPPGHWNSPIVSGGRVILPTGSYHDSAATSALEILHLPGR